MNDLTDEQRARALEMYNTWAKPHGIGRADSMPAEVARGWLAVEAHMLASHACPDVESDSRIRAWLAIAEHRLFTDCYSTGGTLVDAMVAKLDAAHTHTCEPVWRPTTREEIQPGWEVRSRRRNGYEAMWGITHHRDRDGDWRTEAGALLTHATAGWTYETTAPLPEPEPWPDELVGAITGTIWPIDRDEDARAVLDLLAARGLLDRAAITGGEQA